MSQQWQIKFYRQSNGTEPVKEFLKVPNLTESELNRLAVRLRMLQEMGLSIIVKHPDILKKIKGEDNLYEMRLANTTHNPRIMLCVIKQLPINTIYLLHAFKKKDEKIPKHHLKTAIERKNSILNQFNRE